MRVLKLIQDATIRERGENMLNYWWVTRPKRKLNSVPEVLATFADMSLNQEWEGQRDSHLAYEDALETAGLKRKGERRDQTGGGARTYKAWLVSLGLIFTQESTNKIKLTLAGEAIMNGNSPVEVLTNQILKYQFPSSFSIGRGVQVSERFRIRPFRFLLKLLDDSKIGYLTEEEIAKIIVTEAENESEKCYNYIVQRTGIDGKTVEDILIETYPHGSVGAFMTKYFEMAFKGRDEATEFEKATVELFQDVFEFEAKHVGPIGLTPDVLLVSDSEGYQAILDNKAYHKYTINNDHHNRMVHNYIGNIHNYSKSDKPLAFFSYIAGGFGSNIDKQLNNIVEATGVNGSAMSVSNMIKMVEQHECTPYSHQKIRDIFSLNRQVLINDIL